MSEPFNIDVPLIILGIVERTFFYGQKILPGEVLINKKTTTFLYVLWKG